MSHKHDHEQDIMESVGPTSHKQTTSDPLSPDIAPPVVWSVAGSDSSGGAGIQADLRVFHALNIHGCTVVTALTAQDTKEVYESEPSSLSMLDAQLTALKEDLHPRAIKIGMLCSKDIVHLLCKHIKTLKTYVVCDPVMVASSGQTLLDEPGQAALVEQLFPEVDLLTPNLPEVEAITKIRISDDTDREKAARTLLDLGARAVLIKGGHAVEPFACDYWTNGTDKRWIFSDRSKKGSVRGTGCTLASAIASYISLGFSELDAIVLAKSMVRQGIETSAHLGNGCSFFHFHPKRAVCKTLPWTTSHAQKERPSRGFPTCSNALLGIYPIVDSTHWIKKLVSIGIRTIQLRMKHLQPSTWEKEIQSAVEITRAYGAKLFVNDAWRWAIKYRAYGVHLGQDDLETADLDSIREAGLRLGISTHSYSEMAQAFAHKPSYIAIGTVYRTESKKMNYPPLGVPALAHMCSLAPMPVVAIGGITLERAQEVCDAGAQGIAVISDLLGADHVQERTKQWLSFFKNQKRALKL